MQSAKYSLSQAKIINLSEGNSIVEYPIVSKVITMSRIYVNGRRPDESNTAFLESDCSFVLYVIEGSGKIHIESSVFELQRDDVATVVAGQKRFIEGKLSYAVATSPAFYPEQSKIVDI